MSDDESRCAMVVDWKCDEYGLPGDEILCGKPAFLSRYCREHADEMAKEGLDNFTKADAVRYCEMTGFVPPPPRQTKRVRFHIDMTVEMPAELAELPDTVKEPSAPAMRTIYRHAFKGIRLAHGEDLRLVTGSIQAQLDFRSADLTAEVKLKAINESVRDFTGEEDAAFAAVADTFDKLDSELNRIAANIRGAK